jgi:hypothetical protein
LIYLPNSSTTKAKENRSGGRDRPAVKKTNVCFTAGGGDRDRERAPMMVAFVATLQASDLAQGRFLTYPILAVIDSRQAVVILSPESEHEHISIESG